MTGEKKNTRGKACPSGTLFTAHLTRTGPRLKISLNNTLRYLRRRKHRIYALYRVARSRLTHFEFEYCAGAIACRGWRQEER